MDELVPVLCLPREEERRDVYRSPHSLCIDE